MLRLAVNSQLFFLLIFGIAHAESGIMVPRARTLAPLQRLQRVQSWCAPIEGFATWVESASVIMGELNIRAQCIASVRASLSSLPPLFVVMNCTPTLYRWQISRLS
mmetsp:Transcript_40022/g.103582  ORF Transcript_40022/g.103582 Transcript_40022/m.103582 type:complete len:106 (-) Transcript_40022:121-438(-)